ncbi:MAG TPA: hypothetical protein VEK15_10285 [Vicinamibacteria bacterium]|nr:hypothetical protein [Vicinamibacteria bacterium]
MSAPRAVVFALLAVLSVLAKVYLAGLGHNFDLESWALFAQLIQDGKNVYAETYRNPYGPVWGYVCAVTSTLQVLLLKSHSLEDFHRLIALWLSLVDVGIAFLLVRRFSMVVGALFLLNPVSLLVSGFHSQFDNLAVLFALAACILLDRDRDASIARTALALSLLGLSLAVKHVLIFLPFWFFIRPQSSRPRRLATLTPLLIFGASFLPFIRDERGLEGVIEHVFLYDSFHLDGFFPRLVDTVIPVKTIEALFSWVPVFSGFKLVFLLAMLLAGLAVRFESYTAQLLVYLVAMVVFASANADQYLAIPLAACCVFWRRLTMWWYVSLSTLFLAASPANIGMLPGMSTYADAVRTLGLDRSHPIAALLVFLASYVFKIGRPRGAKRIAR